MTPAEIFGLVALMALGLILLFAIRVRLDGLQSRIAAVTRVLDCNKYGANESSFVTAE